MLEATNVVLDLRGGYCYNEDERIFIMPHGNRDVYR